MGTKANPAPNDCYVAADDDEPIFTLRAKDPVAVKTVAEWIGLRVGSGLEAADDPKITEAAEWMRSCEEWREANPERAKHLP